MECPFLFIHFQVWHETTQAVVATKQDMQFAPGLAQSSVEKVADSFNTNTKW